MTRVRASVVKLHVTKEPGNLRTVNLHYAEPSRAEFDIESRGFARRNVMTREMQLGVSRRTRLHIRHVAGTTRWDRTVRDDIDLPTVRFRAREHHRSRIDRDGIRAAHPPSPLQKRRRRRVFLEIDCIG